MATHRWQNGVHYYEYSPDSPERYEGMDAFKVSEAYIYAQPDSSVAFGIVMVISGRDLLGGITMEQAINTARDLLHNMVKPDLAGNHYDDAKKLTESKTLLYTWNGQFIRQALP